MADVSPEYSSFFRLGKSPEHIESIHLKTITSLSLQISSSPLVKELSFNLLVYIKSDQVLILVILMDEIHGVSVPSSQRVSLSFGRVVSHYLDKLLDSFLQVLHVFGTVFDFLKGILCSHVEGLREDLEEELGGQQSDMSLICSDDLLPLIVHAVDIVFVSVVQFIHFSNQIISLISQSSQIILQSSLLTL